LLKTAKVRDVFWFLGVLALLLTGLCGSTITQSVDFPFLFQDDLDLGKSQCSVTNKPLYS